MLQTVQVLVVRVGLGLDVLNSRLVGVCYFIDVVAIAVYSHVLTIVRHRSGIRLANPRVLSIHKLLLFLY